MTAINYLDRVNLSIAAGSIAKELALTPIELGWILSAFLWSYIVVLIPAGYLADRFGAWRDSAGDLRNRFRCRGQQRTGR